MSGMADDELYRVAVESCFNTLGQFSVNQLVMFFMLIVSFIIIIFLVISMTKQRSKFMEKEKEWLKILSQKTEATVKKEPK